MTRAHCHGHVKLDDISIMAGRTAESKIENELFMY